MKFVQLIALIWLLSACALSTSPEGQAPVATSTPVPALPGLTRPTFVVERGLVQKDLSFTGRWLPRDQMILSFPIAGTLRAVTVQAGDSIVAGQLLAEYQIDELRVQEQQQQLQLDSAIRRLNGSGSNNENPVTQAEFALASANLSLQQTQESAPWIALSGAQRRLEDAQRALDNAQRNYDELRGDPVNNSASVIASAYNGVLDAQSALASAQESYYSAAQSYNDWTYSVLNAENSVLQNELALSNAQNGVGLNPDLVDNVSNAQITLDRTRQQIQQSTIIAPFDGIVLDVRVQAGANVQAFAPVVTIAIPQPFEVVATLGANDVQQLDIGRIGVCQVAGQADTMLQCLVRRIPLTPADRDQTVRLAADFQEELATGQLIETRIPLQVREDVLWLPPAAIRRFQNRTFVVLQTENGEQISDVVLGLETDTRIEVVSGVSEGDVVVAP